MSLITIRERGVSTEFPGVIIDGKEFPLPRGITTPSSDEEEARREWYFEEFLEFPAVREIDAREAAESITLYGEKLFEQVFADPDAYRRYQEVSRRGAALTVEVVGSPDFQRLHWEALKDPRQPRPLAVDARLVRRPLQPPKAEIHLHASPFVNVLVVVARPGEGQDVGYRTISRPLVETLRQAHLRVSIDIVRPGTFQALVEHLQSRGAGYYHIIHFDVHGALLSHGELRQGILKNRFMYQARPGRPDLQPYEGQRAFLFLEGVGEGEGKADPLEASELAALLLAHQVPVAILNACQSGKQVGASETSLASQLTHAGVQMVLAVSYSVTVSAAEILMTRLFSELFSGADLGTAVQRARQEMYQRKGRRAFFNQTVELEDWLLPVVYQNQQQGLETRELTEEERAAYQEREQDRYQEPGGTYGFVGRDLDVLQIEKRLLTRRNVLLVRGMAGAGKSSLLHHLGTWWQTTGFVEKVFYFGYDECRWTRQQILERVGRRLWGHHEYERQVQPLREEAQQARLMERLRPQRHLLILDNLESITGTQLAILNTLTPVEQEEIRELLQALGGGRTLVLLGSRGEEQWLAPGTFEDNRYELPGLDSEAASILADRILLRHGVGRYRTDAHLRQLLRLLDGCPLALEVVLSGLARQEPRRILEALGRGEESIDVPGSDEDQVAQRTRSLLACIGYSHSNLSPEAQRLLLCLAPFAGVIHRERLVVDYTERLKLQPGSASLPFERWDEVLAEAEHWGLLTRDSRMPRYLRVQPIFPYFLRRRTHEQGELARAIETAFRAHYDELGQELAALSGSTDPYERQVGVGHTGLEYENLMMALRLALAAHEDCFNFFSAIFYYLKSHELLREALAFSDSVVARLEEYPPERKTGGMGQNLMAIMGERANLQVKLQLYEEARSSYAVITRRLDTLEMPEKDRWVFRASLHHQAGMVAQQQQQWAAAESSYQQALAAAIECGDRDIEGAAYHHLGIVAGSQRRWLQAQSCYQQALAVFTELGDRAACSRALHQLGMIAMEQRQWIPAEACFRSVLTIAIEFNDSGMQRRTYHHLGMVMDAQRQWKEAESCYQSALALDLKARDLKAQAHTYHQLGRLAEEQQQWAQAEGYHKKALAMKIELGDRHSQAFSLHQLGMVAHEQGQREEARGYYQQALAILIETGDRKAQGSTCHQLGTLAREQGQWQQAEAYYQQALEFESGDPFSQSLIYHQLGVVAQKQGQWTRAESLYLKAYAIKDELGEQSSLAVTCYQLGSLAYEQRQEARAAEYYLKALATFVDLGDIQRQATTLHSLALLRQRSGDPTIAANVAPLLGTTPEAIEELLREVLESTPNEPDSGS
jgi:tetratricopeptide (TPR) repeat protein